MNGSIACPECRTPLRVPEACQGFPTKCPRCLADFVIPGALAATDAAAVCVVAEAGTDGIVTRDEVERLRERSTALASRQAGLELRSSEVARHERRQSRRLRFLTAMGASRDAIDNSVSRLGGLCLAVAAGAGLTIVLARLFAPVSLWFGLIAVLGAAGAGAAYLPFAMVPSDAMLRDMIARLGDQLRATSQLAAELRGEQRAAAQAAASADAEYRALRDQFESRLQWLRTCQWPQMTGANFENFLVQVFEELGYEVARTGKVGDQGVDLIATRHGRRIAVQAKGYPASTVGNDAVQQVHAGCAFYRCDAAAVVTNSRYSPSARALAERIGCRLIDGSEIADLINGRIEIVPSRV